MKRSSRNSWNYAYTIFLPAFEEKTLGAYPDLLDIIYQKKCIILQTKAYTAFYAVGWYEGKIYKEGDLVEIYYIVAKFITIRALCVRLSFMGSGYVQVVEMEVIPPGLQPMETFDLAARHGPAFRKARFQPRLLPLQDGRRNHESRA